MSESFEEVEKDRRIKEVKKHSRHLERLCREIASAVKREDMARDLDISYSYFSEILNSNGDQKSFKLWMIPALTASPKFHDLINFLCDIAKPVREHPRIKPVKTAEEELTELKQAIVNRGLESVFEKDGITFEGK